MNCAICKRSDLVVTLKSCFNEDVCGSCKKNYYNVSKKLVKALSSYDPVEVCANASVLVLDFIQCELQTDSELTKKAELSSNRHVHLVNDLCKSCRFLIGFDLFEYKIPDIAMIGLSVEQISFLRGHPYRQS